MKHHVWTIELPRTASECRADHDEAVDRCLSEELTSELPDLRTDGGWPDDEQIEIVQLRIGKERLEATISVYFIEVIPSACRDLPNSENRQVDLVLTMERGDSFARVNHSHTDPEQWDLLDRNSAADGS